jgi:hypothetical protein
MKLIQALVALLVVAGLVVPVVAVAEDRLSLSGEMRVRAWHTDYDLGDFDESDSTQTWADQRLRIAGKLAVAEGVSITFRTDITESTWGSGNLNGSGRTTVETSTGGYSDFQSQHWDRAHLDVTKGNFHVRAGQQYNGFGTTRVVDSQSNGLSVDYKFGDVPVNVFFQLIDDNGSRNQGDAFLSGAKVAPKFGDVATSFYVANWNDGRNDDEDDGEWGGEDVILIGADVKAMFGPVNFKGEVDFFTGDAGGIGGVDYDATGTNVWLDGSMAATDAVTVGAQLFYGAGDDEDVQYTYLGTGFWGFDPLMDVGTQLDNWSIAYGRPFNMAEFSLGAESEYDSDISLGSLGAIGARLYTDFKASDSLSFGASIAYAQEEEDAYAELDTLLLAAGMVYQIMPNTTFQMQVQYSDGTLKIDDESFDEDFDAIQAGSGLFVKF